MLVRVYGVYVLCEGVRAVLPDTGEAISLLIYDNLLSFPYFHFFPKFLFIQILR